MTLRLAEPPPGGVEVVKNVLAGLHRPAGWFASVRFGSGLAVPATDQLANPYRIFELGLSSLKAAAGLASARPVGWRYLILRGPDVVQAVDLAADDERGLRLMQTTGGPLVGEAGRTLARAEEEAGASESEAYELCYLRVPGVRVAAIWLKPDPGAGPDKLFPISPSRHGLQTDRSYRAAEFLNALAEPADKALEFDRVLDAEIRRVAPTGDQAGLVGFGYDRTLWWYQQAVWYRRAVAACVVVIAAIGAGIRFAPPGVLRAVTGRAVPDEPELLMAGFYLIPNPTGTITINQDGEYVLTRGLDFTGKIETPKKGYAAVVLFGEGVGGVQSLTAEPSPVKMLDRTLSRPLPAPRGRTVCLVVVTPTPITDQLRVLFADSIRDGDINIQKDRELGVGKDATGPRIVEPLVGLLKAERQPWAAINVWVMKPDRPGV